MWKINFLSLFVCINIAFSPVLAVNLNYFRTCIKDHCFDARVADNPVSRSKGLMGEVQLPIDEGMLFIFPMETKPGFWMNQMKFGLDIIFINDEDTIVYMVKNAPACNQKNKKGEPDCPVFTPTRPASKVLEINAGLSNKYGIHVGDKVVYFIDN